MFFYSYNIVSNTGKTFMHENYMFVIIIDYEYKEISVGYALHTLYL